MSDGMSDSRPHQVDREQWSEVDGIKLHLPLDVSFRHFRDGIEGDCYRLNIGFFISRWGTVRVEGGLLGGGDAVAFVQNDCEATARKVMVEAMKLQLTKPQFKKYLQEGGHK